jgi:hypothetical protein
VATTTSIAVFGRRFEKMLERVKIGAETVHQLLTDGGEEDHFEFTAGGTSTKDLRRMGHPYGRTAATSKNKTGQRGNLNKKMGKAKVNPLPINKQTGRLRSSFYRSDIGGKDKVTRMGFRVPYARFVLRPGGTRKMIDRKFYSLGSAKTGPATGIIRKQFRKRLSIARAVYRRSIKS